MAAGGVAGLTAGLSAIPVAGWVAIGVGVIVVAGAVIYQTSQRPKEVGSSDSLPTQGQVTAGVEGAPPVAAGQQGKHVPGHNSYQEGKSTWANGANGVKETQEGWLK